MTSHIPLLHQGTSLWDAPLVAHPLVQHTEGFSPLLVTVLVVAIVLTVATRQGKAAGATERPPDTREAAVGSWAGSLSGPQVATRCLAVALLLLAVAAGRLGTTQQLRNLAPALLVGTAWPLLILASSLLGAAWRWVDPWDGLARLGDRGTGPNPSLTADGVGASVWPTVIPAVLWVWYLGVFPGSLEPRSVGAAAAIYTVVTVAGCLALGRSRWLSTVEVFGLLFGWLARLPRALLGAWRPPEGTEVVLGVIAGGLLFGAFRRTSLWGPLNVAPLSLLYSTAGLGGSCALVAGAFWWLRRWAARTGDPGAVAAAIVPAVGAVALALALARNRFFTSLQLLPALASDPLGLGWDLFGTADWGLVPEPLGHVGLAVAQILVVLAGHVAGAWVLARRTDLPERRAAILALVFLAAAASLAVTLT